MLYNPFSIQRHLHPRTSGFITYGGGGGGGSPEPTQTVKQMAKPTEQQLAMRDAADYAFMQSPVILAAQEADKALQKQAMQQAGLSGPPTNREEAERFRAAMTPLMENSPEIQAARKAQEEQNAKMQLQHGQANALGGIAAGIIGGGGTQTTEMTDADLAAAEAAAEKRAAHLQKVTDAQQSAADRVQAEADAKEIKLAGETPAEREARLANEAARAQAKAAGQGAADMMGASTTDPGSLSTTAAVQNIDPSAAGTELDADVGQIAGDAPQITDPDAFGAASVDPTKVAGDVATETQGLEAVQGTVSDDAQVQAAQGSLSPEAMAAAAGFDEKYLQEVQAGTRTVSPDELTKFAKANNIPVAEAQSMLTEYQGVSAAKFEGDTPEAEAQDTYNLTPTRIAAQQATTVQEAAKASEYPTAEAAQSDWESTIEAAQGSVGANELVNARDIVGAATAVTAVAATMEALDTDAVAVAAQGSFSQSALAKAAQGTVPPSATVQGQMANLMEQFNNGTPAWAAGAMRAANAAMAARGIGGSSMAGAAIVQATMEAAIPIASQDAQMFGQMNMANLSNRQQVAIANAAAQQNMELANLSNSQQAAMQNSANAFALQSQNLSNVQATVLANAQFKAALQNKVIDVKTQTSLANAAKYAEKNNINLNNRQQAAIQNSAQNLQVAMANLSNEQQTALSNLQVRASLVGQELSNEQQMAVLTTTQDFQRANFNASAKQQAFLQDASARAALEGKAMDIRQQTQLFNVSSVLEERKIELSNEQQTALFNTTNRLSVDMAEMSNRQQTELANAQIEAALRGQEMSNEQQSAVLNAAKFAEAANMTFTAAENAALSNSKMMQTIGLSEMSAKNTAILQNAANLASMDMANLNNRQQAAVMNAQAFLQMDMKNMDLQQQTDLFKTQQNISAIFSDQAADNAAKQFNASSENQTNQFFANMSQQVQQFNAGMEVQRDQFNTENALIVAQANAQWRQNASTVNASAQNQANLDAAKTANQFTQSTLDQVWQRERDIMDYAFRQSESSTDRALSIFLADKQVDLAKWETSQDQNQSDKEGMGYLFGRMLFD